MGSELCQSIKSTGGHWITEKVEIEKLKRPKYEAR